MRRARKFQLRNQAESGSRGPAPPLAHGRRSWKRLGLSIALALFLGLALALVPPLGGPLFRALGLGGLLLVAVPALTLLGLFLWAAWGYRVRRFLRWWNLYVAAIFFALALLGGLSFVTLPIELGGTSLARPMAGGSLGQALGGGGAWGVLKVSALALGGLACLSPRRTWRFLVFSGSGLARLEKKYLIHQWAWAGLTQMASGIGALFILLFKVLGRLAPRARLRPRPREVSPPSAFKAAPGSEPTEAGQDISRQEGEAVPSEPVGRELRDEGAGAPPVPPVPHPLPLPRRRPQWRLPGLDLLEAPAPDKGVSSAATERQARLIEEALASYGVEAKVVGVNPGPTVTQFAVEPGWDRKFKKVPERDAFGRPLLDRSGQPKIRHEEVSRTRVKVERITSLGKDLALALSAPSLRIEAPVPGKGVLGIEVPNVTFNVVSLRSVLESPSFLRLKDKSKLALALGKGAAGEAVVADLARMPHLLVAGATGSGKTVCLNAILITLLVNATPAEVRLLLIDPKRVEFTSYNLVPHLLAPVVVEREDAVAALRKVVREMELRYRKLALVGARNIEAYNHHALVAEPLPYLVVVIDELADLMLTAADVVEPALCRLAQLARATGIHLVVATQRPSVDVVTGLIKANFPCRIAFAVASQVDSRTILDTAGADKLLGRGDMLYQSSDAEGSKRLQGSFASDAEIERVTRWWLGQGPLPSPQQDAVAQGFASQAPAAEAPDPIFEKAKELAAQHRHISASLLQRRLRIGYPRAARLMELLAEQGLVKAEEDKPDARAG